MKVECKHCGRFLFKAAGTVVIEGLICPNTGCKAALNFKIVNSDPAQDIKYKFVDPERPPRTAKEKTNE